MKLVCRCKEEAKLVDEELFPGQNDEANRLIKKRTVRKLKWTRDLGGPYSSPMINSAIEWLRQAHLMRQAWALEL